ncbi:MAG: ATP-dependent DNA helicase, partial [bacterium]
KAELTAPTGRAAKRLTELTGAPAQTVHRLLEAGMPEDERATFRLFGKNADDKLACGAVILDETSMMDITLMSALLEAMRSQTRLILVGDADQLPSVGPGNVFSDIIRSGAVPVVRLNEIFRQAEASAIVKNAHRINHGEPPELKNRGGDFFFLQRRGAEAQTETVAALVAERLPGKMGIPPEEIQVLSPSRKTAAGTGELNRILQERLNPAAPEKKEKPVGGTILRVGDRVMQTKNNYGLIWYRFEPGKTEPAEKGEGIYNGDIGYIEDIDERRELVKIRFEDRLAAYPFETLGELELAYAVTVHKSQGSEYRAVILAIPEGVPPLKTRSVLYTAVTRARELLVVVGDSSDLLEMVGNDRRQRRYSGLRARLAQPAR